MRLLQSFESMLLSRGGWAREINKEGETWCSKQTVEFHSQVLINLSLITRLSFYNFTPDGFLSAMTLWKGSYIDDSFFFVFSSSAVCEIERIWLQVRRVESLAAFTFFLCEAFQSRELKKKKVKKRSFTTVSSGRPDETLTLTTHVGLGPYLTTRWCYCLTVK